MSTGARGGMLDGRRLRVDRRLLLAFVATSLLFGAFLAGLWAAGAPLHDLLRDAASGPGVDPWTGLLAIAGLMGWVAAAAACGVTGLALRARGESRRGRFMLATAALLGLLAADDGFQFHEGIGAELLGIPDLATYAVLGGAVLAWLWSFRDEILATELGMLLAAFGGVGMTVGLDVLGVVPIQVEDPFKLVGIAAFVVWAVRESLEALEALAVPHERAQAPGASPEPLATEALARQARAAATR
ncbi:MAG: hypothetical protein ACR2NB_00965 [Solirubrobacteraceae bacterium]